MLWLFAALLTLVCCAALFMAARARAPLDGGAGEGADKGFFRSQLEGLDADIAAGRLSGTEAVAARAELAREYLRIEAKAGAGAGKGPGLPVLAGVIAAVGIASLGLYVAIGRADLPAQPLAERLQTAEAAGLDLAQAVAQVEARMEETPNDIRGWMALGPIYMETRRYGEAANAFRRILALEPPTADRETDLAEALIMAGDGLTTPEAMTLLEQAAERDPGHIRSRFYLAGERTRLGDYAAAVPIWEQLLALASGEEAWVATARAGLAAAQAGLSGTTLADPVPDATEEVMIRGMVEGLAARLYDGGGSAAEWMQLVRSRNVLDGPEAALLDLARGLAALEGPDRAALADFALDLGLEMEQ